MANTDFTQKYDKNFEKIHFKIRINMNVPLYQISDNFENVGFRDQVCPKNVNDKKFGKINIKFEIKI